MGWLVIDWVGWLLMELLVWFVESLMPPYDSYVVRRLVDWLVAL